MDVVANTASLLKSFCGRNPHGTDFVGCPHDHTAEAKALVDQIGTQVRIEALIELLDENPEGPVERSVVNNKIGELSDSLRTVPAR